MQRSKILPVELPGVLSVPNHPLALNASTQHLPGLSSDEHFDSIASPHLEYASTQHSSIQKMLPTVYAETHLSADSSTRYRTATNEAHAYRRPNYTHVDLAPVCSSTTITDSIENNDQGHNTTYTDSSLQTFDLSLFEPPLENILTPYTSATLVETGDSSSSPFPDTPTPFSAMETNHHSPSLFISGLFHAHSTTGNLFTDNNSNPSQGYPSHSSAGSLTITETASSQWSLENSSSVQISNPNELPSDPRQSALQLFIPEKAQPIRAQHGWAVGTIGNEAHSMVDVSRDSASSSGNVVSAGTEERIFPDLSEASPSPSFSTRSLIAPSSPSTYGVTMIILGLKVTEVPNHDVPSQNAAKGWSLVSVFPTLPPTPRYLGADTPFGRPGAGSSSSWHNPSLPINGTPPEHNFVLIPGRRSMEDVDALTKQVFIRNTRKTRWVCTDWPNCTFGGTKASLPKSRCNARAHVRKDHFREDKVYRCSVTDCIRYFVSGAEFLRIDDARAHMRKRTGISITALTIFWAPVRLRWCEIDTSKANTNGEYSILPPSDGRTDVYD
ncbi:hypothetical protein K439DRAFT_1617458 [Ramaria rubella]|nr:hypothetical protein K439DRAFT_1617458 [Ramaria rubella]